MSVPPPDDPSKKKRPRPSRSSFFTALHAPKAAAERAKLLTPPEGYTPPTPKREKDPPSPRFPAIESLERPAAGSRTGAAQSDLAPQMDDSWPFPQDPPAPAEPEQPPAPPSTPRRRKPAAPPKPEREWPGLLIGWILVMGLLFVTVLMVLRAKPEKPLVCDTTMRTPSLTRFGSCRREE